MLEGFYLVVKVTFPQFTFYVRCQIFIKVTPTKNSETLCLTTLVDVFIPFRRKSPDSKHRDNDESELSLFSLIFRLPISSFVFYPSLRRISRALFEFLLFSPSAFAIWAVYSIYEDDVHVLEAYFLIKQKAKKIRKPKRGKQFCSIIAREFFNLLFHNDVMKTRFQVVKILLCKKVYSKA